MQENNPQLARSFREALSRPFHTLDVDPTTGDKVISKHTTGMHYLSDFEINLLVNQLRNILINKFD